MRQAQRFQYSVWDFPSSGVQKDDHAGEIFRVFKNLFRVAIHGWVRIASLNRSFDRSRSTNESTAVRKSEITFCSFSVGVLK